MWCMMQIENDPKQNPGNTSIQFDRIRVNTSNSHPLSCLSSRTVSNDMHGPWYQNVSRDTSTVWFKVSKAAPGSSKTWATCFLKCHCVHKRELFQLNGSIYNLTGTFQPDHLLQSSHKVKKERLDISLAQQVESTLVYNRLLSAPSLTVLVKVG